MSDCAAGYRRIELISKRGDLGQYRCSVCGHLLETIDGAHEVAYRLTVNQERPASRRAKKVSH